MTMLRKALSMPIFWACSAVDALPWRFDGDWCRPGQAGCSVIGLSGLAWKVRGEG